MRRFLTIMATAALACGMLAGCGNDADNTTTNDGVVNEQDATTTPDDTLNSDPDTGADADTSDNTVADNDINNNDNSYTNYSDETVWGKVTAVDPDGFKMDVGILDDDNVFAVNDEKANVKIAEDTEIKLSALNDALNDDNDIIGDGTIDDIQVGDMVSVEYDSNGEVDTIKIMSSEDNNQ